MYVKKENYDKKGGGKKADEKTAPAADVRVCTLYIYYKCNIYMCYLYYLYIMCVGS